MFAARLIPAAGRSTRTPGQLGGEPRAERLDVDPGPQPQIEAVDAAGAVERRRHAGDVGDPEARAVGAGEAGHPEAHLAERDLQRHGIARLDAQPLGRGRAAQDRVRPQRVERVGDLGRNEVGLHESRPEDVEAEEAKRLLAPRRPDVRLDHRARYGDLGQAGEARVERLVEACARAAQLEVGGAGERLHGVRELADRRLVDELHRVAERDAERDRGERERKAAPALPERAEEERAAQRLRVHCRNPADRQSERADGEALGREHGADLPPGQPEVAQHPELAPAREHQRAEARRQAGEPDHQRDELEHVGDRERAVEGLHRARPDLARRGDLERVAARQRGANRAPDRAGVGAVGEPERGVARVAVAGEPDVAVALDDHCAVLPDVVAPHAGHGESHALAGDRQLDHVPRGEAVEVDHRLGHPGGRRRTGRRRHRLRRPAAGAGRDPADRAGARAA